MSKLLYTNNRSLSHTMAMRHQVGSLLARRLAAYQEKASVSTLSHCQRCLRSFSTTAAPLAGHNKWSKTKHIKAVTDKKKMTERTTFTKSIAIFSKLYGEDLKFNPQLANAISAATKAGIPKALIEGAIARGQGRSVSGAQLEAMTFEVLVPPNIAMIADVETDNKVRTLHDIKYSVKKAGGLVGSTAFYFSRRGRIVLKGKDGSPTLSDLLEEAIEHEGVEDVLELPEGAFLVWTEPSKLMAITEVFSQKFDLEIEDSDIIWAANEDTQVDLDSSESAEGLINLLASLKEFSEVKAISANVRQGNISDDEWERIEENL
ncbi:putative transcriptional regulatory protein C8D2.12c [Paramyrothecium foliicola]|nr:putative transcriptional regulatory protein C8D2.12c [Paramyrothecium foliicola]